MNDWIIVLCQNADVNVRLLFVRSLLLMNECYTVLPGLYVYEYCGYRFDNTIMNYQAMFVHHEFDVPIAYPYV